MHVFNAGILWWLAPLLIAIVAAAGITLFRHLRKTEWQIEEVVEETEESG